MLSVNFQIYYFLAQSTARFLGGSSHEKGGMCRFKKTFQQEQRNIFQCHFGFRTLNLRTTNITLEVAYLYLLEERFSSSMHCDIKKNLP